VVVIRNVSRLKKGKAKKIRKIKLKNSESYTIDQFANMTAPLHFAIGVWVN